MEKGRQFQPEQDEYGQVPAEGYTFESSEGTGKLSGPKGHTFVHAIHPEHGVVGTLQMGPMDPETGTRGVNRVNVHPDHVNKGIARGMLEHAINQGHSPWLDGSDAKDTWVTMGDIDSGANPGFSSPASRRSSRD